MEKGSRKKRDFKAGKKKVKVMMKERESDARSKIKGKGIVTP